MIQDKKVCNWNNCFAVKSKPECCKKKGNMHKHEMNNLQYLTEKQEL